MRWTQTQTGVPSNLVTLLSARSHSSWRLRRQFQIFHEIARLSSTFFAEIGNDEDCLSGVHKAKSGRPNNRKPEGRIKNTLRLNRKNEFNCKGKFNRKAENSTSIIRTYSLGRIQMAELIEN